ncbi:MAG: sulfatase-like hydrolase/transferase, partial [Bacteroidales bacterium]|nr:sulfatase-like hydrolase/transferase [Bacteroidales bacterium]
NKDTSFFLYLPLTVPHLALQVPEDEPSLDIYKQVIPDTPYIGDKGYLPNPYPHAAYAAMITRMDREIGRIIELLKSLGLDQNTVVFFTSDNGPTYDRIGGSDSEYFESNKPFSGLKGSVHEGGIRVPLVVWWPGEINPGIVSDHIAAFQDVLPTLIELSNVGPPAETDGISFLPALRQKEQPEHEYLYWEFPAYGGQQAVRMGKWKAIRKNLKEDPVAPIELYDLESDIAEKYNVADQHEDIILRMEAIFKYARIPSDTFSFPALDRIFDKRNLQD